MARVEKTVLVAHPAQQMFDLVDGCEAYPEFLPWCGGAQVLSRTEHETVATIVIDYHLVKQKFTTRNAKNSPHRMDIQLVEGPFRRLQGVWQFIPLDADSCKIEFSMEYDFASRLLEKVVGPIFNRIASTLVDAFVARADGRPVARR